MDRFQEVMDQIIAHFMGVWQVFLDLIAIVKGEK